eukprot:COSAG05_NODE_602_length_8420_cov_13.540199_8_plen_291_part_00
MEACTTYIRIWVISIHTSYDGTTIASKTPGRDARPPPHRLQLPITVVRTCLPTVTTLRRTTFHPRVTSRPRPPPPRPRRPCRPRRPECSASASCSPSARTPRCNSPRAAASSARVSARTARRHDHESATVPAHEQTPQRANNRSKKAVRALGWVWRAYLHAALGLEHGLVGFRGGDPRVAGGCLEQHGGCYLLDPAAVVELLSLAVASLPLSSLLLSSSNHPRTRPTPHAPKPHPSTATYAVSSRLPNATVVRRRHGYRPTVPHTSNDLLSVRVGEWWWPDEQYGGGARC